MHASSPDEMKSFLPPFATCGASAAKCSLSNMCELSEQRRLLRRPRIVTSIKRMDQPDMLGDAAFRDTGASLRREGQSFRQIAEALELSGGTTPRYEDTMRKSDL